MNSFDPYPKGTDVLWMARYVNDDGEETMAIKMSGEFLDVVEEANAIQFKYGDRLQCINRRY